MIDRAQVERAAELFRAPDGSFERLLRRRDRKRRNQRIGAGALAIIIALVSFVALTRAFSASKRPADEPVPKPRGIFSGVGGWIVYGDEDGIWAVDPTRPDDPNSQIQLSTDRGTPLDWSSDGSKLLILSYKPLRSPMPLRLFVLNADGSETTLATSRKWSSEGSSYWSSGGSFSPDGSQVVYAAPPQGTWRSAIYVVDTQGGTPRVLLSGGRRLYPAIGRSIRSWLSNPTYSPDGTQIAYFDHQLDGPSQLRVMNADGTGVRVLLDGTGYHSYTLAWSPDGERLAWADEDLIPEHQTDRSRGSSSSAPMAQDSRSRSPVGRIRIGHRTAPASHIASVLRNIAGGARSAPSRSRRLTGPISRSSAPPNPVRGTHSSSRSRRSPRCRQRARA